jgi:hypothetical protein
MHILEHIQDVIDEAIDLGPLRGAFDTMVPDLTDVSGPPKSKRDLIMFLKYLAAYKRRAGAMVYKEQIVPYVNGIFRTRFKGADADDFVDALALGGEILTSRQVRKEHVYPFIQTWFNISAADRAKVAPALDRAFDEISQRIRHGLFPNTVYGQRVAPSHMNSVMGIINQYLDDEAAVDMWFDIIETNNPGMTEDELWSAAVEAAYQDLDGMVDRYGEGVAKVIMDRISGHRDDIPMNSKKDMDDFTKRVKALIKRHASIPTGTDLHDYAIPMGMMGQVDDDFWVTFRKFMLGVK